MMSKKLLQVADIPVTLTRKRVKNINLRISRVHGRVSVSAPTCVNEAEIVAFLYSKIHWISERLRDHKERALKTQYAFKNGEEHAFLGERYPLKIVSENEKTGLVSGAPQHKMQLLQLSCANESSRNEREKILEDWYRKNLKQLLPETVKSWATKLELPVPEYRVKKMKTKWGTCNINDRRIWISLELIKYPKRCIDYVVLHELSHFFERHHNARFYSIIETQMPDWKYWEAQLNPEST